MQVEIIQKRGGVADYFAVLGIGERFEWQHTKKKAGMLKEHERNEELESEVDLMKRFYREIVEVDIVTKGFDIHETSTIASQGRNYPDEDRSQSSYDSAKGSSRTNAMENKLRKEAILSTETLAISSDVDSSTARYSMLEWDGFTILRTTCQAGRASGGEDQACLAKILLQEKSSNSMSLWSKSQIFNANLDPFFGFRGEILGQTIHDAEQTSFKQIGRKVTSTIRHQFAPLLHAHDQRLNRPSHGLQFLLAFRQRGPDEIDRPAIADLDLRFIRIHVDTIYSTRIKSEGLTGDTSDTKSETLRRGIHTGVAMAARVAEASKQKILEKYREKYVSPKKIISVHNLNHIDVDHSDAILVSLEDLLTIPGSFDEWVIPEPFQRIKIPAKAKSENLSSFRGGRKTHVLPLRMNDYRSLDQVLVEDTTTQASDPSGIGVEAYFDGSSFVLSPASSVAGTSDISAFQLSSAGTVNNMDTPLLHDDLDLASSFEVLEPSIYMPQVLRTSDLPILSSNSQSEPYEYIPVLVTRRQRVGDEERYHEDPAVVDLAVTFRDSKGDVILPQMLDAEDDDDKEMEFNILDISPWSDYLDIGDSRSEQTLGSPAIILRRNRPLGLADVEFSTRVLDRFPQKNYKGFPLPEEELPMFCYPTGCRLIRARYSDCPLPQYFGFVVKNERGESIYVSCVSFMERITKEKVEYLNEISHRRNRVSIPHRIFSRRHSNQRFASTVNYHDINHTVKQNGNEDSLLQGFDDMTTFENKTICLISRYPFWTAFRRFLSNLHTMSSSPSTLPVERYISHLLLCVALPKPGGPSIIVPLPALCYPMLLSLPPNKDFPLVDLPFQTLFACLDVPTVVTMVIGMLALERKLIVVSTWPSLLLDVCELLKALLFPFELCAPYVPRLTEPFMSCLDFPGAIFVGIHDDRRTDGLAASVRSNLPEDSILVDLDTGCINCCDNRFETIKSIWKGLPLGPKDVLVSELETLCRDACIVPGQEPLDSHIDITFNVTCGQSTIIEDLSDSPYVTSQMLDDRAIRDSFMRFFATIMAGYEQFLVPPDLDFKTSGSEWFDTHGFLSAASPPYTSYLESFVCTQLFQSFIQRRTEASDIHCLLFDECLAEYHSSPIPYGRLGGDVETVASIEDGSSQMLYSLLVDQCCAESYQISRPVLSEREQSVSGGLQSKSVSQLEASDVLRNQHGDLVMIPSKKDIPTNTRFVYTVDGNPCFPQKMNVNYFHPFHPSSRLIEVSDSPPPLITRTEREVEESLRRQKMTSENSGIRNQSRCLWQLPKLMASHFLGSWLICVPSQVSQRDIGPERQSQYLIRALGAMHLLRNKQRILPDEAAYRAMIVACGSVATDRRLDLGALFGLLRADGIFPSAVTLGQYTRSLAEGYSKRASRTDAPSMLNINNLNDKQDTGSIYHRLETEELMLTLLDGDISVLEESGRRWRSRSSSDREWENKLEGNETLSAKEFSRRAKDEKKRSRTKGTSRPWYPVSISSSFVPTTENLTLSSDFSSRVLLVALWSRTTACESCSYIPLDEEIQSCWSILEGNNGSQTTCICPRCHKPFSPLLGYYELDLIEASCLQTEDKSLPLNFNHHDVYPEQLCASVDSRNENLIPYLSPSDVRLRLEDRIREYGEGTLNRDNLRESDPILFFNFWWYCSRFSLPFPLPIHTDCNDAKANDVHPKHACAFSAWGKSTAIYACCKGAEVILSTYREYCESPHREKSREDINVFDADVPLLSKFNIQNLSKPDWDHSELSKVLVGLVDACDHRDLKPVMECMIRSTNEKSKSLNSGVSSHQLDEMDWYKILLYLVTYHCTSAFHVFFPTTVKPCRGYHYWCAYGSPLPVFDRMFRDAMKRLKDEGIWKGHIPHVPMDVALGFRCIFGHMV